MPSGVALLAGLLVTIIALVVAFRRALDPRVGGGFSGLCSATTCRTIATFAALLLVIAAIPFIGGLTSDTIDTWLLPFGIFLALTVAFFIARQYPPGWASFVAVVTLVTSVWAGGGSLYLASIAGWQDMSLDDISGLDRSPTYVIAFAVVLGTIVAPLPGLLIGIMARRPSADSPSA